MADRLNDPDKPYPYRAHSLRTEYQPLTRMQSRLLFDDSMDAIEKMLHEDVKGDASELSAHVNPEGLERALHVTHLGPVFNEEPRIWLEELDDSYRFHQEIQFCMNSIGKITHLLHRKGLFWSETRVSIRDYPSPVSDPIVTDYILDEYRSGVIQASVAHSLPQLRGRDVRIESHRMTKFDYEQLAIDLQRIQSMQHADQPAQDLTQTEYLR